MRCASGSRQRTMARRKNNNVTLVDRAILRLSTWMFLALLTPLHYHIHLSISCPLFATQIRENVYLVKPARLIDCSPLCAPMYWTNTRGMKRNLRRGMKCNQHDSICDNVDEVWWILMLVLRFALSDRFQVCSSIDSFEPLPSYTGFKACLQLPSTAQRELVSSGFMQRQNPNIIVEYSDLYSWGSGSSSYNHKCLCSLGNLLKKLLIQCSGLSELTPEQDHDRENIPSVTIE